MKTGREVVRRLGQMLPAERPPVLLHGDMALHNILYSTKGPVLVDLERAGMGDPLQDMGQLVAHLREMARRSPEAHARLGAFEEQMVHAYLRGSEDDNLERLAFFTGCALADRAAGAVIRRGLDRRPPELLRLALEATKGASSNRPAFFIGDTAGPSGLQWEVFYPKLEPEWPGFLGDPSGEPVHGVYDANRDAFREVRPEEDGGLPALAKWVNEGELLNYRAGRRATVRLAAWRDGHGAYVKILPPRRARRLLRRYRAVKRALSTVAGEAPLIPPLLEGDPDEGVIVFGALTGRSLSELVFSGCPQI
jgi:hypothetical protein